MEPFRTDVGRTIAAGDPHALANSPDARALRALAPQFKEMQHRRRVERREREEKEKQANMSMVLPLSAANKVLEHESELIDVMNKAAKAEGERAQAIGESVEEMKRIKDELSTDAEKLFSEPGIIERADASPVLRMMRNALRGSIAAASNTKEFLLIGDAAPTMFDRAVKIAEAEKAERSG